MKQLQASEVPLNKVFSSDYDFRIPDYQRPYAWGIDEARQLLDDLTDSLDRPEDEPYFLGSIVLVKDAADPAADIIDGQQRLTTVTILLAVLRDMTSDADYRSALAAKISEPGDPVMNLTPKPRLALRSRDQAFFREHVQQIGSIPGLLGAKDGALHTAAQRNIRDNAQALQYVLDAWSQERRDDLAKRLMARTFLVVVTTPDLESAHRIFSVMNSRDLDLTPPDIFKAQVVGVISPGASADYTEKWEDAEQAVGRDVFVELFLLIRLIHSMERAKQSLLREFPEQVLKEYLPGSAKQFIDEVVVPYAEAFAQMTRFTYTATQGAENVNAWFKRFAQLDTTDWQAPALWALYHHGDDPQWLDRFLRKLERLASSMFIRRVYLTPRMLRYVELLRQLHDGLDIDAPALELDPVERAETIAQLNGDIYLTTKTRKYVLLRLDEVLANSPGVTYDHRIITVEHVLPQHPKADSNWERYFTEDERTFWTHRLANLLLLNQAKNSEAQNYDFDEKKAKYFQSDKGTPTFALTGQVLSHQSWTPEVLKARQTSLLGALATEWDLG